MGRLLRYLAYLAVILVIGVAGYALLFDLPPPTAQMSTPVDLNLGG